MSKIIEVKNLTKRFNNTTPVKQVNFTINTGEFVTLLGSSGSGKSTLLSLTAGLERPSSGDIFISEQNISQMTEDKLALMRRKHIGFVFQSFRLIPTINALENIAFPLYPIQKNKTKRHTYAQKLLTKVGLSHRATHLPSQLSGGECQRVAIARALANQPELIFCDEPTGNLDSNTGREILDLLVKLNKESKVTIFMVTHDENIAKISDRSLYMDNGVVNA